MKKTAKNLKLRHKKAGFAKNRKEEELEDAGKMKKAKKMACKTCGSMAHAKHSSTATKKKAAVRTQNARYENMRKKVFGLKSKV